VVQRRLTNIWKAVKDYFLCPGATDERLPADVKVTLWIYEDNTEL
jgi:hypothetical protein